MCKTLKIKIKTKQLQEICLIKFSKSVIDIFFENKIIFFKFLTDKHLTLPTVYKTLPKQKILLVHPKYKIIFDVL